MVVPSVEPVKIPVPEPMVATPVELLAHVPPATPSPKVMASPAQTAVGPVIAVGAVNMVTIRVVAHP